MKSIDTLVDDIYGVFANADSVEFNDEELDDLGRRLASRTRDSFVYQGSPRLRISNLGKPDRQLWYTVNTPELAEPLEAHAKIKFLFGHLLEELLLFFAKKAGHEVRGEQDDIDLYGVSGHRDAVIDNVLVDVKSASSYSFSAFQKGLDNSTDSFGYLTQLHGYHAGSSDSDPDIAAFLVIDKTLGKICLDKHPRSDVNYEEVVRRKQEMLASSKPPPRCFSPVPFGKSGNLRLDVVCSYCPFKKTCWPGLRTFIYSTGPVFLTQVNKLPEVLEVE